MPEPQAPAQPAKRGRPFPWHCPRCRQKQVQPAVIPYACEMTYEGERYKVEVPRLSVPRCGNCGELVFTYETEAQIRQALRAQLRLLEPGQIIAGRTALGITQAELAERLGVPEATFARWESDDEFQPRAADNLMRVYFALPEVRSVLLGAKQDPQLGVCPV